MACNCHSTAHLPKVLLWSGGFDSTLMLLNLLDTCPETDIILLTIQSAVTGVSKLLKERTARERVLEYIKIHYSNSVTKHIKVIDQPIPKPDGQWDVGNCVVNDKYKPRRLASVQAISQPIFWMCNAIPLLPQECVLQLGYISEDHAFIKVDDIRTMVKAAGNISDKDITVGFPMQYYSKAEVLRELMENHPEVLNLCVSCESLTDEKHCTTCNCCIDIMRALAILSFEKSSYRDLMKQWFELEIRKVPNFPEEQSFVETSAEGDKSEVDDPACESCSVTEACDCKADMSEATCLLCGKAFRYEAPGTGVLCNSCQELLGGRNNRSGGDM